MARIYMEYAKNILVGYPDYFMLLVFVITSFMLVSVHDVLNNIPKNNLPSAFSFFVVALRNTSFIIQALIVGFLIRVVVTGSRLTYRNTRNLNINVGWIIAKLKY